MKHKVLSIAGFDGSGGAGIQADLKTFSAFGCYGMTVLTALPVQNTCGVRSCYEIPLKAIQEQLETIFDDIIPDSIKIGMLFKSEIIELIAKFLEAKDIPIVLDPVMIAKSGDSLLLPEAINSLKTKLIPLATIITPNLPEAQKLTGLNAIEIDDMPNIARTLLNFGAKSVLLKGGHLLTDKSSDLYLDDQGLELWLEANRISTQNTHGTGCTLSAAIASGFALGLNKWETCKLAKHYLHNALQAAKGEQIGYGSGPVHHFYHLWPSINKIRGE